MDKTNILQALAKFNQARILVIGDVILDAYYRGNVQRISPEAPVPIVELTSKEYRLGGAANVALNVKHLGAECILCSTIGTDSAGDQVLDLCKKDGLTIRGFNRSASRTTSIKTRIINGYQQMLRVDEENTAPLDQADEAALVGHILKLVDESRPHAIIFEDYDKGVVTAALISRVIESASKSGIPVAVDPKKKNFFAYDGCTLFKPNLKELREGLNWPSLGTSDADLAEAFVRLNEKMRTEIGFFTLSGEGVYITNGKQSNRLPAFQRSIADVSGAGDTVIATATCAMVAGLGMEEMALVSNLAAGWVCQFPGVVSINNAALVEEVQKML